VVLTKSKISPFMHLQDDQTAHSPVWRSKNANILVARRIFMATTTRAVGVNT